MSSNRNEKEKEKEKEIMDKTTEKQYVKKPSNKRQKKRKINPCPGCGYEMGFEWPSQYCSRICFYHSY